MAEGLKYVFVCISGYEVGLVGEVGVFGVCGVCGVCGGGKLRRKQR